MAHFRRKKPSIRTGGRFSNTTDFMHWWPRWHDVLYLRRPKRRQEAALLREVTAGRLDPDGVAWPTGNRKPHLYYW